VLANLATSTDAKYHPLFVKNNSSKKLIIAITSDRGLAGAYNSNISRMVNATALATGSAETDVICIGRYAALHVARVVELEELAAYDMDVDNPDVEIAQPVLAECLDLFTNGKVGSVEVIYTKFISTVKQEVVVEQLLPISVPEDSNSAALSRTYEPNAQSVLSFASERMVEAMLLQAILESRASEQASRMLAMKNATDNANDLIEDLTLEFNNARQAHITQELAEISAGAEAINEQ
jgi:F-type H+-transporting ATPase subunit gamma